MQPVVLQSDYALNTFRDKQRHLLPRGTVWSNTDYIPGLDGGGLTKRGGWGYASPAMAGGSYIAAVSWAPFVAGSQLVAIDNTGDLHKVIDASNSSEIGAAVVPVQRPVFFKNLLIIPGSTPKKYTGAAVSSLGGTPPAGIYAGAYKGRLVLAGDPANPERYYFSDVYDPETWDTSTGYLSATQPSAGMAILRNVILAFSKIGVERVRGDIPPPGGDMVREPLFPEGCIDARSIAVWNDRAIWANANGVFSSDGAAIENLTRIGGMLEYWTELMRSYTSSYTIAAGIHRDSYFLSVMNGEDYVTTMVCDLSTKSWSFMSNITATMFAESYDTAPELYFGDRGEMRVGKLGGIYVPSSANRADADGTSVQPVVELPYYRGKPGKKRWRELYVGVEFVDTGSNAPTLEFAYTTSPGDTSYQDVVADDGTTKLTVSPAAGYQRVRIPVHLQNDGIGVRISQVGRSDLTRIYDIEAAVRDLEGSR